MEGRKEAFRMYLEQTGTTDALTKMFTKLCDLKDKRPATKDEALKFMKDELSNDFPTQGDYNQLMQKVEESRKKVNEIRKVEEAAATIVEEEKLRRKAVVADTVMKASAKTVVPMTITQIEETKRRLEDIKKNTNFQSLLVKCLDLKMFDNQIIPEHFILCIKRGLEDPDLPVGIYAANEADYEEFKPVFHPIIREYFGDNVPVQSDWKSSGSEDKVLNFRSHLILRTRISCARSIQKFPFVPQMNEKQLKKLKADVEAELKLLTQDDVKGRYVDLSGADKVVKLELEKAQLLFEPENAQLKAAGVTDFSHGRAIFYNNNNLVVWVNEEEHLKFIATGTDSVKETFIRLRTVVENCKFLAFKQSSSPANLPKACLTFCPTYLGPAIHISVLVKLPDVAFRGKVQETAKYLKIHVKPTKVADQFEVTNKPKLNQNEFDSMKEFIGELKKLLGPAQIKTADGAVARLKELQATPPESLLIKNLTQSILTAAKTDADKEKVLLNCIRMGLEDGTLPVGIYAAAEDAYEKFGPIFEPIIKAYYEVNDLPSVPSKWDPKTGCTDDDLNLKSRLILRTRITCARSIQEFPFVPAMNKTQLEKLKTDVGTALGKLTGTDIAEYCDLATLKEGVKAELEEKQLLFESENVRLKAAGVTDFSHGRATFYSSAKNLVVWVNEEEHLKFIATGTKAGNDEILKETFIRLRSAVQECGLELKESVDLTKLKRRHLTFCPTNLGPTIHISAVVKFPNVKARKKLRDTVQICVKPTKLADQFEFANKPKLNRNEFDSMKEFIGELKKLLEPAQIKTKADAVARLEELQALATPPESLLITKLTKSTLQKVSGDDDEKALLNCIRMGLEDGTMPVGIYAAAKESYVKFKTIFDPIIMAHYGLPQIKDIVESKWDDASGNDNALAVLDSALIRHARITCAKSVETYDFVPTMTPDQLNEFTKAVKGKLEFISSQNICEGTFVNLSDIDPNVKSELEKAQLLFDAENARLKAAGVTDFSEGRAIYYNTEKNLAIWVNEEEHLKFIATGTNDTTNNADIIKKTFIRLRTAVKLTFQKSSATYPNHTVTFCPTYLGPAIHISVTVKLEKAAERGIVKHIAETLDIYVKPTAEEHEFEVTNKPTLQKTEFVAIKEFIDELKKLVEAEEKLIITNDDAWNRWDTLKNSSTKSLLIDNCPNKADYTALAEVNGKVLLTKNGKSLLDCIRPGLEDVTLQLGIYAVDNDAYETFAKIFKPIVEAHHRPTPDALSDAGSEVNFKFVKINTCVKSSRITCRRSFKEFPFIPAMNTTQLRELRAKVKATLEAYSSDSTFYYLEDGLADEVKKDLVKRNHWCETVNKRLRSVGVNDFTTGRAVFVNKDKDLTVWICEEDHLKFISTDESGDIGKAFHRLKHAVDKFAEEKFEKHAQWGWKTFCPTNLGTTIAAAIVLELPKITAAAAAARQNFNEYCSANSVDLDTFNICAKPMSNKTQHEITNKSKFGNEFDLVKSVYNAAIKLAESEDELS